MKSNLIAHIVILTLLLVSTANSFALACLESISVESERVAEMEHSDEDCHSNAMSSAEMGTSSTAKNSDAHCEQLCFCEQAANSPQTFAATPIDSPFDGLTSSKYAPVHRSVLSVNTKPPTPPPTLFKIS